jgi:dTDP-4-amino-4,6-dideoxygalactose transaminase|tara:strand:- start:2291 stop:3394 length:1104 start_codon:yes stop_codon:yes gene_type:complete
MKVPFLDLHASYIELQNEIDSSISRVLSSGRYIGGSEVESFEDQFSNYCGSKFTIGVANGLDALVLSLKSLDIGMGDEVIVPANTFIATWLAVSEVGAIPVPVEPNPLTYNIDVEEIQKAITPQTKAIIPVHLFGQPADLDPILLLAKQHNLFIIEDAAQAIGSRYKEKKIGAHGDLVCWSFYPGKNLGAFGDAGAISTNNEALANKIRSLSNYGSNQKYIHNFIGMNSRLDPMQAAILKVKLRFLDSWIDRRKNIASVYSSTFKDHPDFKIPYVPDWAEPVWHLYVINSNHRNKIQNNLTENGIETIIHYPIPPHLQDAYSKILPTNISLPVTECLAQNILSLPIGPHLLEEQYRYVIECLNKIPI